VRFFFDWNLLELTVLVPGSPDISGLCLPGIRNVGRIHYDRRGSAEL
jgi:hypothetical protein